MDQDPMFARGGNETTSQGENVPITRGSGVVYGG